MPESHQVVGLNAFLFSLVVCICVFFNYLIKKYQVSWLPESGAAMLLGMVIGCFMLIIGKKEEEDVMFKPAVFFFVLLPPIIFEAGYTLKRKNFFSNLSTILFFAVFGTFISTMVVGYGLYGLAKAGLVPLDTHNPLECLMFGALISAVDPVATLSILGSEKVNADPMLYSIVFGESVLNDAVSIVLFNTFKNFQGRDANVAFVIGEFIGISVGSILIGCIIALASSFMFKHTQLTDYHAFEFTLMFFFAYCAYLIAEIIELSGIMSLFFCGIVMAHYAWYNLSTVSRTTTKAAFESFSLIAESFLFAYLGITAVLSIKPEAFNPAVCCAWDGRLITFTLILIVVARALNIFPLGTLANIKRRRKVTFPMMIVMWFAGLRGAIAFALSLNIPTANRPYIVTTTMVIVIFTTLVCGGFTETVLRRLGLQNPEDYNPQEVPLAQSSDHDFVELDHDEKAATESAAKAKRYTPGGMHWRWKQFDEKYMKPWFGGKAVLSEQLEQSQELTSFEVGTGLLSTLSPRHRSSESPDVVEIRDSEEVAGI